MNQRLRALCDLSMSSVREYIGRHEYDGRVEDLSPEGVRAALARLGGPPEDDQHDEAQLAAFERLARLELGELELHRANPLYHVAALDVSCYDREYAPATERAEARRRHLAAWPDAVEVDLGRLEERADAERDRMRAILDEACGRLRPGQPTAEVVAWLLEDHPDADGVLREAEALTAESIAFTLERGLVPGLDGECLVAPSPPSRRWALAMMSWAAPYEADAPSRYYISPPEPDWPATEQDDWLKVFSRATLPAITVHEVAPGHFAHGRRLRLLTSDVRRTLHSLAFVEGWAHYGEELCIEEGYRGDDPRFAAGVALEALQRVTRLAVSIGTHAGTMTVDEAAARFEADAFCYGPAARTEASRATFDPTYGRYTWGKLEIMALRDQARAAWGAGFSLQRFHDALLSLGSPPLGLMPAALDG